MLDTVEGVSGYTQIHCIWLKSGYNKIQSLKHLMNLGLDTMRYNVSGPSLDTMDTNLASRHANLDGKYVFSVSQTDPDTQCIIAYHKHTSETAYLDTLELLSRSDGNSTHRTHKQHIFKNLS